MLITSNIKVAIHADRMPNFSRLHGLRYRLNCKMQTCRAMHAWTSSISLYSVLILADWLDRGKAPLEPYKSEKITDIASEMQVKSTRLILLHVKNSWWQCDWPQASITTCKASVSTCMPHTINRTIARLVIGLPDRRNSARRKLFGSRHRHRNLYSQKSAENCECAGRIYHLISLKWRLIIL